MYYICLYIFLLKFHTVCSISYEPFEVKCSILSSSWHSVVGMEMHYQDRSWVTSPPTPHPLGQGRAGHLDWQHHQDCTSWSKAGFPKENQHATYQNGECTLCRRNQQMPTVISMALSLIGWYLQCSHNSPPLLAELLLVFCLLED